MHQLFDPVLDRTNQTHPNITPKFSEIPKICKNHENHCQIKKINLYTGIPVVHCTYIACTGIHMWSLLALAEILVQERFFCLFVFLVPCIPNLSLHQKVRGLAFTEILQHRK